MEEQSKKEEDRKKRKDRRTTGDSPLVACANGASKTVPVLLLCVVST